MSNVKFNVGQRVDFEGLVNARNPQNLFVYHNDFSQYAVGDWTLTTVEAGAGSATEAVVTDGSYGPWGVLLLTNAAGADDQDNMQSPEIVKLESTKPTYFRARIKVDDTGLAEWFVGLAISDTTLIASGAFSATDGIGFLGGPTDASADTALFEVVKDSTATDSDEFTIANDTFYVLEFFYDGTTVYAAVDGVFVGQSTTNIPDNEFLAISFAINNSSAVIRKMAIDDVYVAQVK